jgi:hypothetical protein
LKQYALNSLYEYSAVVKIAGGARRDGIFFNTSVALHTDCGTIRIQYAAHPDVAADLEVLEVIQYKQSACISLEQYAFNSLYEHAAAVEIAGVS